MIAETLEYFVIAFISSAVLIVLSKIILQNLIRRPADYYLAEELRQEEMMLNSAGFSITEEIETNPEGEMTSEHITVTPQLTVDETVEMHLIERENIPERFIEESLSDSSDSGEISDKGAVTDKADGVDEAGKAGDAEDTLAEMEELREIILASTRETAAAEADMKDGAEEDSANPQQKKKPKKKEVREKKDKKEKDKQEKSGGKPSMKMRKDELLAIAAERGIDIPEKITKKEILELINADDPESKQNRKKTGNKQDRNKNGNDQSRNKTGNKQDRNKDGNDQSHNKNGNKRNRNKNRDSGANKNNKKNTKKKQEDKQNLKQDQKQEK